MSNQESNEAIGNEAFSMHKQIANNELARRTLMLENSRLIHEMHSKGLYKVVLGDTNAPWSAYLSQHDTYYTASKIYMLDKIYGKFVKELGIDISVVADVPNSKLSAIISFVTKENVNEWLTKAGQLTSQDFQDEIRKAQGKVSYLECPHKKEVQYAICQSCSHRHKI